MSRLSIDTQNTAEKTVEELYKDLERRVQASQPGLCPVDLAASFLKTCYAQSCGKCVPCRVGLGQLEKMLAQVLDGPANPELLDLIERTAQSIYFTADCAIGSEAARMILKGVRGFRDDYIEHIEHGRCKGKHNQPVPCVSQCPAHVDIPGYIALIHEERYTDAVQLIRKDNPFPSVCGLICEHPCEVRCRRTLVDDAVNIRGLKRYACEHAGELPVPEIAESTGKKVAVIGGGPSGLSAAFYLSIMGHDVTVYEQRKQLGGMLRYGIPNYRLPRAVLDREIANMKAVGFKTICDVRVGKNISISEIREQNDAVYVSIGAHTGSKLSIEGDDAEGVISAVEILRGIGDDQYPDFTGQHIAVVGGGNVAMDVARTALRCGAETVRIIYRRRIADMTAMPEEIHGAIEDGCEISELLAPLRVEKNRDGHVVALWVRHQISGPMEGGRLSIVQSKELEDVRIPCDKLLVAVHQVKAGTFLTLVDKLIDLGVYLGAVGAGVGKQVRVQAPGQVGQLGMINRTSAVQLLGGGLCVPFASVHHVVQQDVSQYHDQNGTGSQQGKHGIGQQCFLQFITKAHSLVFHEMHEEAGSSFPFVITWKHLCCRLP